MSALAHVRSFALGAALFAATAGAGWALRQWYLPGGLLPGLLVDGEVPPRGADEAALAAFVRARANLIEGRRVRLVPSTDRSRTLLEVSLGDLGVAVDVDAVVARAMRLGHEGDPLGRFEVAERARRGQIDVPLLPSVDAAVVVARVSALKEAEDHGPLSARLDLERRTIVGEKAGVYLDAFGAAEALDRFVAAGAREATLTVPQITVPPRITARDLSGLDVKQVLGSFETFFSRRGDQELRGRNIEVAVSRLDGLVLSPGEVFSFNAVVGERSEESGFKKSWEILKGEMTEGIGGGTCQVASTIHAAAFFGGLDILERLPHSRPSAYIPMGLDATVVYPSVDLKLRNPYAFPVAIHATVSGTRVKFELLGADKPVRVAFAREVVETLPYRRKVVEDGELRGARVVLKQHGIRGYRIRRRRTLFYRNGRQKTEEATNLYPPTTEIYEVPPRFDLSLLPPLPWASPEEGDADSAAPVATDGPAPGAVSPGFFAALGAPLAADVGAAGGPAAPSPAAALPDGGLPPDPKKELASRGIHVIEPPGTHAPTRAQAEPDRAVEIRR